MYTIPYRESTCSTTSATSNDIISYVTDIRCIVRADVSFCPRVDKEKVDVLKQSIAEIGLLEPIDVLLVDGVYYGFSGCHRFQAHQELGKKTILCRVRRATKQTLKYHLM